MKLLSLKLVFGGYFDVDLGRTNNYCIVDTNCVIDRLIQIARPVHTSCVLKCKNTIEFHVNY